MNVLFVWTAMAYVGGVTTYILQNLDLLPGRRLNPRALDLFERDLPYQGGLLHDRPDVVRLDPRPLESEWSYTRRIYDEVIRFKPDVVVLNELLYADSLIKVLPESVPLVNIAHVDRPDETYYRRAEKLFPRLDAIACVSTRIEEKLKQVIDPQWHERIVYRPLGIEVPDPLPPIHTQQDRLSFIYFGRISQVQKRVRDFVPLVRALNRREVPFHFTIVGEGEQVPYLKEALAEELEAGQVELLGPRLPDEAMKLLAAQDVILLMSDYEGLPLTLLEAAVRGVVPVVSRVESGVAEVFTDGTDARFFEIGNIEQAADILNELNSKPDVLARLKEATRTAGLAFSMEKKLDAYETLYRKLVEGRGRADAYEQFTFDFDEGSPWKMKLWNRLPEAWLRRYLRARTT
ncbi:MAG: glycosyltransferase family 4 protein [Verrucomicrobiota bacterium]